MNPRRVSILLAFAPLVSYPAWTERSSDPLVIGACDAYKQSNAEYSTCLPGELQALEQELVKYVNAQRRSLRTAASGERGFSASALAAAARRVDVAEGAWKKYRDAHCTMIENSFTTGTGSFSARVACQIRLTRSRLHQVWEDGWTKLPEPQ